MKKKWTLTPDAFNQYLALLSSDREEAGRKYVEMKQELVSFFTRRGHPDPEKLANETLDRAARKALAEELNYSGDHLRDLIGFARNVSKEARREKQPEPIDDIDPPAPGPQDQEALFRCMDQCLAQLTEHSKSLLTRYHQDQGRQKIIIRQLLADEEKIGVAALRIRVHRILTPLRECFFNCIEKENAS